MWYVEQHQQQLFVMVFYSSRTFLPSRPTSSIAAHFFYSILFYSASFIVPAIDMWPKCAGDDALCYNSKSREMWTKTTKIFCFSLVDPLAVICELQHSINLNHHITHSTQHNQFSPMHRRMQDNCRLIFHYLLHTLAFPDAVDALIFFFVFSHEIESIRRKKDSATRQSEGMRNHKDRHIQRITVIASINSASQYFFDAIISVMSNRKVRALSASMERTKRHDLWFFVVLCSLCLGLFDECVFYISSSSSHIVDRPLSLSLLSLHIVHNTRKSMDWRNPKESKDCNYVSFWKIEFLSRLFHSFLVFVCTSRILSLHTSSHLIWCDLWLSLSLHRHQATATISISFTHIFHSHHHHQFTRVAGDVGRFCMLWNAFSELIKSRVRENMKLENFPYLHDDRARYPDNVSFLLLRHPARVGCHYFPQLSVMTMAEDLVSSHIPIGDECGLMPNKKTSTHLRAEWIIFFNMEIWEPFHHSSRKNIIYLTFSDRVY